MFRPTFSIRTNMPPEYRDLGHPQGHLSLEENFEKFFEWGLSLRRPLTKIPGMAERLGFGTKIHPLGFHVVYLSEQGRGEMTPSIRGMVRANIYPPGVELRDDIHSHGFDFYSGVIAGKLTNTRYFPEWGRNRVPEGEGLIGYEGRVDMYGRNQTVRATDAIIATPRSEAEELVRGAIYTIPPKNFFHAVDVPERVGTVTIFCKTPTYSGSDGISLTLRKPVEEPVPANY